MNILTSDLNRIISLVLILFSLFIFIKAESVLAQSISASPDTIRTYTEPGTSTITWDSGSINNVIVRYTINGDDTSVTTFSNDSSGTMDANFIMANNTYEFCFYINNGQTKLPAFCDEVTGIFGKSGKPKLKPRYKTMDVRSHGTYADISFTTNFTTTPLIMISRIEPNPMPKISDQSNPELPAFEKKFIIYQQYIAPTGKSHSIRIPNLLPGRTYHYVIVSQDYNGTNKFARYYNTFKTLDRHVKVRFQKIKVIDDSDDTLGNSGDFLFSFYLDKQNIADKFWEIDTDETKIFDISNGKLGNGTVNNDSESVEIRVGGFDNDLTDAFGVGDFFPGMDNEFLTTKEGCNGDGEWTVVSRKFYITPDKADEYTFVGSDGEFMQRSFKMYALPQNGESDVKFRVDGILRVFYN